MKSNADFVLDKNHVYDTDCYLSHKPNGLWYQIKMSIYDWGSMSWGDYMYALDINESSYATIDDDIDESSKDKILKIDTFEALEKFVQIYRKEPIASLDYINWSKLSKIYGGIEFDDYLTVKSGIYRKTALEDGIYYMWFTTIDFDSGCIWNLDIIKGFKFYKELTNNDIEQYEKREYDEPYLEIDDNIDYSIDSRIREITLDEQIHEVDDVVEVGNENKTNYLIYFLLLIVIWLPLYHRPQMR